MKVENYMLDSSALLTLMEDEEGADRVETLLKKGNVIIPFLSLLEVYYVSYKRRGQSEADRRYALLKQIPATFLWDINEPVLLKAAYFKANYRVSLADAIMAAYSNKYVAILLHKDPEFEALSREIQMESLPLKTK